MNKMAAYYQRFEPVKRNCVTERRINKRSCLERVIKYNSETAFKDADYKNHIVPLLEDIEKGVKIKFVV